MHLKGVLSNWLSYVLLRSFFDNDSWANFATIAALLKLSTKYQVDHLREKMIQHLTDFYYPTTLKSFDNLETKNQNHSYPQLNHFRMLVLLRQTHVLRLLPAVFYRCCVDWSMDTLARAPILPDLDSGMPFFGDEREKALCIAGRARLMVAQTRISHAGFSFISTKPLCDRNALSCSRDRWQRTFRSSTNNEQAFPTDEWDCDPLSGRHNSLSEGNEVCDSCQILDTRIFNRRREDLWRILPSFFSFHSWDVLLSLETDVTGK